MICLPLMYTQPPALRAVESGYEVPFRCLSGYLCVRAVLGGRPLWFALDSGAGGSFIDLAVLRGFGKLRSARNGVIRNLGATFWWLPSLQIGAADLRDQWFTEGRFAPIGAHVPGTDERIAGILGYNILRLLCVGIDFRECRLWAWGPDHTVEARRVLFGGGGYRMLSPLLAGSDSLPAVRATIGGIASTPVLDLGSTAGGVSSGMRARLGRHFVVTGRLLFDRPQGKVKHPVGIVDQVTLGPVRMAWSPTGTGTLADDFPSLLGWTDLAPLGRVLLDFTGGALYAQKGKVRFGFLDKILSYYDSWIDGDKLVMHEKYWIKLSVLRSVFTVPVPARPLRALATPGFWTPERQGAARLVKIAWAPSAKYRSISYVWNGRRATFYPPALTVPLHQAPVPHDPEEVPYRVPGYYLRWNGHVSRLPAGEVWFPHSASLLAVGGLQPLRPMSRSGPFCRASVPAYDEDIAVECRALDWRSPRGPVVVSPDGTSREVVAVSRANPVPAGYAAAAPDGWITLDPSTGILTIRRPSPYQNKRPGMRLNAKS